MARNERPRHGFKPLQRVLVIHKDAPATGDAGVIGHYGTVIWRSPYYATKSHSGATGWLYIVRTDELSDERYEWVEESHLLARGTEDLLTAHLGRGFEISYDETVEEGTRVVQGTFRVPGGFWNTFVFRKESVANVSYQISMPVRLYSGPIARYTFAVPESTPLDRSFVEKVMSDIVNANGWRRVSGPRSEWFG